MGQAEDSKLVKILLGVIVAIIAILAIIAIIIAAVSLGASRKPDIGYQLPNSNGNSNGGNGGGNQQGSSNQGNSIMGNYPNVASGPPPRNKIFMIGVGHDWGAQEYLDAQGFIQGFQMDLIAEVCQAGQMQCRTVWEPYKNCYDSEPGQHSFGGKGLMGRWYDACCGWVQTVGRMQIFDFSKPFLKDKPAHWYQKEGGNFDHKDLTKASKIGFLDGWSTDEKCVARLLDGTTGIPLEVKQITHYQTTDQIVKALHDDEIDAAFLPYSVGNPPPNGLERVGDDIVCSMSGSSMMTRKDNDFNMYWNRGFDALVNNGGYQKLCQKAIETHQNDARDFLGCV